MRQTVDVAMSVYGKPYQTAATLASLLHHSGQHIGTIWFQEELEQPYGANVGGLPALFPGRNFNVFRPHHHLGYSHVRPEQLKEERDRHSIRYQLAWERTDKDYLFICHNDTLYTSDTVGGMIERLNTGVYTGVGWVGQCWNCPAHAAGVCDGDRYETYRPTYEEALAVVAAHPKPRTLVEAIDRGQPAPLPECRLNEFGCLINLRKCRQDTMPFGPALPFGHFDLDVGTEWFGSLTRRGHRFLNWYDGMNHALFADGAGHPSNTTAERYTLGETRARAYLAEHFSDLVRLIDQPAPRALSAWDVLRSPPVSPNPKRRRWYDSLLGRIRD